MRKKKQKESRGSNSECWAVVATASAAALVLRRNAIIRSIQKTNTRIPSDVHTHTHQTLCTNNIIVISSHQQPSASSSHQPAVTTINIMLQQSEETNAAVKERRNKRNKLHRESTNESCIITHTHTHNHNCICIKTSKMKTKAPKSTEPSSLHPIHTDTQTHIHMRLHCSIVAENFLCSHPFEYSQRRTRSVLISLFPSLALSLSLSLFIAPLPSRSVGYFFHRSCCVVDSLLFTATQ